MADRVAIASEWMLKLCLHRALQRGEPSLRYYRRSCRFVKPSLQPPMARQSELSLRESKADFISFAAICLCSLAFTLLIR